MIVPLTDPAACGACRRPYDCTLVSPAVMLTLADRPLCHRCAAAWPELLDAARERAGSLPMIVSHELPADLRRAVLDAADPWGVLLDPIALDGR